MDPRFFADRMLGRLAKMLRLLGYDTLYFPNLGPKEVEPLVRREGRVLLTRGHAEKRFPELANCCTLVSDSPPEQLREVVRHFGLDAKSGLWTRCTLCNSAIQKIEKEAAASRVPPKVLEIYSEFFECAGCGHVYWKGSHVERILKNLSTLLGGDEPPNKI